MKQDDFIQVLECSLLSFSGLTPEEIQDQTGWNPEIVTAGVQLSLYLKSKEVLPNETI